ncbi:MAG: peptidoglycan DD-metalloendopeptidase family protein [Clostridiales bacterium]|nr:peptidoglycan DD-metalloendopeptidase family protein [Clostridiales bacterium]
MMKKEKTLRIALSGVLLLAVVAAGVTMYRTESNLKQEEKQAEEQQMAEETPLSGLSEGQKDAMESGESEEPETADVTANEAQAENTQELSGEDASAQAGEETEPAQKEQPEAAADTGEETEDTEDTAAPVQPVLNFSEDSTMLWPVSGEVVIDYSMDATTYFPTLDLYKYNSGLVLGSGAGEPVQAAANGQVLSITENEETGTTLTMDLGNGYQAVYGQMKDLTVAEGQIVESGTILGYINDPTKYYVTEGPNLYFAMTKDGAAVDPMIYIETVTE